MIIHVEDLSMSGADVYANLTERELRNSYCCFSNFLGT